MLTAEEVPAWITQQSGKSILIANSGRVGPSALAAAIEWYWYAPRTERNRFYEATDASWHDHRWYLIAFPTGRLQAARRLARQIGLRFANGVPMFIGDPTLRLSVFASGWPSTTRDLADRGLSFFPGAVGPGERENRNMMQVENDHGSPVYKNSRRDHADMMQAANEVNDVFQRGIRLTPSQIADYIYGPSFPQGATR